MVDFGAPYIAPFPPNFDGNPWTYGLAMFSDLLVSALCGAQLLAYAFEARHKRQVRKLSGLPGHDDQFPVFSPLNIHRLIICGLLLTLLFRALPDALWMLAWGEATLGTMNFLFLLDWYGDIFALGPCTGSLALIAWSWQVIPQRLASISSIPLAKPKWEQARPALSILAMVLLIAVGVTIGKASA